ncbi:MAG: helix-hairpin-helix domain-containing protein [Candidatus Binataceae bacterium]
MRLKELESIPGIGDKLAKEIVREQTYERVEVLMRVKGIGEYKLIIIRLYA